MAIPGIFIACFAALYANCLKLSSFSMDSIELNNTVNITHLMSSLSFISFIAVFIAIISAVWMEVFSGHALLLVIFVNTTAKPTFLPVLFDTSM